MIGFLAMANTPLGWSTALPMNRAPERLVSIDLYYKKVKNRVYPEFTHDILNNM